MSVEYKYDPESGTFRPYATDTSNTKRNTAANSAQRSSSKPAQKSGSGSDWGSWVLIAAMFMFGIWPVGLYLLISKLKDSPRKDYTSVRTEEKSKVTKTAEKVTRTPTATDSTALVLMIVGAVISFVFGISTLAVIADYASSSFFDNLLGTLFCGGFLAGGLATFFAGRRMKKRTKRIARYLAYIGERDHVTVDELMGITGKKRKTVEDDLEYMVEKGMLGMQAYLDRGRGILFRSAAASQKYNAEKASRENLTPKEANEGAAGALRAIRYANDRIADPELTKKIDHLEAVAGKIFREVENHPEKQQQATTFFNYYLPTTLKLLNTYVEFEDAGIEGENLKKARERIEATMDSLVKGFDKQLDDLYRSEAMDIDSDIRVMESMLRRDISSVAEDFGLGGTAVQQEPDNE